MSSNLDFAVVPQGVEGVDPNHPCKSRIKILDAEAGLIERTRDRLAIIGYASSSRDLAPFTDPSYDCAILNQLYRFVPRADIIFDIHVNWEEENVEGTDHRGWLTTCGIPVVMSVPDWSIPTAVRYPINACMQYGNDYFTSTISFMIAWGIHQGYKEIALYGIDLVVGTEYEVQKACAEYWLGIAHGRGIDVRLPAGCSLMKHSHRYGYEREPRWSPLKQSDFADRRVKLTEKRDMLMAKLNAVDGALHEVTRHETWGADPAEREKWLRTQRDETMALLATVDGALQEVCQWMELALLRSRGADVRVGTP